MKCSKLKSYQSSELSEKISWAEILLFFRRKKKDEKESQPAP